MSLSRKRERRRYERFPLGVSSPYATIGPWTGAVVGDLSTGGARIRAELRPALGTTVMLALAPDLLASGSVVRHTDDGFAVAFGPLPKPPGEPD